MTDISTRSDLCIKAWGPGKVILLTGLFAVSCPSDGFADEELPNDVLQYMTYHLGRWQSHTTYFDGEGNAVKEEVEGSGERILVEGQVNLHYSYNADGTINTAFRYYNPEDDKLYMVDVTAQGQLWIVSGNRGENVQYSAEKTVPDGRKVTLRMTHSNIHDGAFEADVHVSFDHGDSWQRYSHQEYKKIGDGWER